jgi:hypothetical protein
MTRPAAGANVLSYGTNVQCSVTNSPIVNGTTQYVCLGWVGAGDVPLSGVGTSVPPFVLTQDSAVSWTWRTEYRLTSQAEGAGEVNPDKVWVAECEPFVITALPQTYYHVQGWSGDTNNCLTDGNTISGAMDGARGIVGWFAPDLTLKGTPCWWLARHGLTNVAWEAEADLDRDGDGVKAWEEWVSDTDPTNVLSVLKVLSITPETSGLRVVWGGGTGVLQYLERRTNLLDGADSWQSVFTNTVLPTPRTNSFTDPAGTNSVQFYRVRTHR